MNYEILLIAIVFIILMGFQYTLNLILEELRKIRRHLERLISVKKIKNKEEM